MDKINEYLIEQLHPDLRQSAITCINKCDVALSGRAKVRLTYTYRTIAEQNFLYAKGRTTVNPDGKSKQRPLGYKVTNAKGGQSIHNYAMALDIALLVDGKSLSWNDVKDFDADGLSDWMECVKIFKDQGWQWGGDWSSFIDKPHFQKTFGLTLSQLQARQAAKDFIVGTKFINIKHVITFKTLTTISDINLRIGAGTEYGVIQVIPKLSKVIEKKRIDGWSQIEFGPRTGWVSNKYLR